MPGSEIFQPLWKRWIRHDLNAAWNWQPGCFDRLLRSEESLHEKWLYVEDNPVRAGLVQRAADWPYRIDLDEKKLVSGNVGHTAAF